MSEIETQLREYFDAAVERVTAEDVLVGHQMLESMTPQEQHWTWRPAWAAAAGFVATLAVLGGSLGIGIVAHRPATDTGTGRITEVLGEANEAASGWWLFMVAIGVVVAVVGALIARNQQHNSQRENAMATTIKTPPSTRLEAAERNNRGLVMTVVGLAIALVALGAWALFDQAAEPETAAPQAVQELIDDYEAVWNNYDGDAFSAVTTEDYTHTNGDFTSDRDTMASTIASMAPSSNFQVERIGDLVVTGKGPYYVAGANRLHDSQGIEDGISAFVIVETDDGLKVAEHLFVGQ